MQLAPKLNAANLEIEELRVKMIQQNVTMTAMTKVIVELKKRADCLENEKELLLKTNEEVLQRSRLSKMLASEAKKSLVDILPNEVFGVAGKIENAIHKWNGKELSAFMHYGEQNEWHRA